MQSLEVSSAVGLIYIYIYIYRSLGVKGLKQIYSYYEKSLERSAILCRETCNDIGDYSKHSLFLQGGW